MNPERLMIVPCRVVARVPSGTDQYGGSVLAEVATDAKCWYSQPTTEERGGQVFTAMTAYFAPDEALDHVARIDIEDVGSFEVDGSPIAHKSPRTGVLTHKTVRLRAGA